MEIGGPVYPMLSCHWPLELDMYHLTDSTNKNINLDAMPWEGILKNTSDQLTE